MTTFSINDALFQNILATPGVDINSVNSLITAINANPYANAVLTQVAQRGDVVIELASPAVLADKGGNAFYDPSRGDAYAARGNKFAIVLNENWFLQGPGGALFDKNLVLNLGIVIHEADHSNNQALYDFAYQLMSTDPVNLRPDLTGAARVAASVDYMMVGEASGWYADLMTLRSAHASGQIGTFAYNIFLRSSSNQALIAVESQGIALGLSGTALAQYVADHAQHAPPTENITTYINKFIADFNAYNGVDPDLVRLALPYAMDDLNRIQTFTEESGPDGSYIGIATYGNGNRLTTIYDGFGGEFTETWEAQNYDGTYRVFQTQTIQSTAGGIFGDEVITQYDSAGRIYSIKNVDGAGDDPDYAIRIQNYDRYGNITYIDELLDDGSTELSYYAGSFIYRIAHLDAERRTDYSDSFDYDGSYVRTDYDQDSTQTWMKTISRYSPDGVLDWGNTEYDDGRYQTQQFDLAEEYNWNSETWLYDPFGQVERIENIYDDGSQIRWAYDPSDSESWSLIETHWDVLGEEDWIAYTYDDGGRDTYDFDQYGDQTWATRFWHFDSEGSEDYVIQYDDNGGRTTWDYDLLNEHSWDLYESYFDSQDREDWSWIIYDDDNRLIYDFDQDNTQDWDRIDTRFDSLGREDWRNIYYDSGRLDHEDHDQDGSQVWEYSGYSLDSLGRQDWSGVLFDDGSEDSHYFDVSNSSYWSQRDFHYDTAGRKDWVLVTRDDGFRDWYDYDQAGTENWSRYEARLDGAGFTDFSNRYFDDGVRFYVDYNYHNEGLNYLSAFSPDGTLRFLGAQNSEGQVLSILGIWESRFGAGLGFSGTPGAGGGAPMPPTDYTLPSSPAEGPTTYPVPYPHIVPTPLPPIYF